MASKKHHYVPRSLLRNFSVDGRGQTIVVFDKVRGVDYSTAIADAGAENHFNTIEIDGKPLNLEDKFQEMDSRLASVTATLTAARSLGVLTAADRSDLAFLTAIQLLRTKVQRLNLMSMPVQLRQVFAEHGIEVPSNVVPDVTENSAKLISFGMLGEAERFADILFRKDWSLHVAPQGHPFWISDNPVVTVNVFPYGDSGLDSPGVQVCWPIASDLLLSFACRTIREGSRKVSEVWANFMATEPTLQCLPDHIKFYNSLQVAQSSRFIYGSTREFQLAHEMLALHPELKQVTTRTEIPRMGAVPRRERMPDGRWFVVFGRNTHYMIEALGYREVGGGLHVTATDRGLAELHRALDDGPHSLIEFYENKSPRYMMRHVLLTPGDDAASVIVVHADPAERAIAAQAAKSRSTEH